MNNILKQHHFDLIKSFSRKISSGKNSDDLSQHVILEVLQMDQEFIQGLVDREEFGNYVTWYIKKMLYSITSSYSREKNGTRDKERIPVFYDKWFYVEDKKHDFVEGLSDTGDWSSGLDSFLYEESEKSAAEELKEVLLDANITGKEKMYLDVYLSNFCNYATVYRNTGISYKHIKNKINEITEKCRKSLQS